MRPLHPSDLISTHIPQVFLILAITLGALFMPRARSNEVDASSSNNGKPSNSILSHSDLQPLINNLQTREKVVEKFKKKLSIVCNRCPSKTSPTRAGSKTSSIRPSHVDEPIPAYTPTTKKNSSDLLNKVNQHVQLNMASSARPLHPVETMPGITMKSSMFPNMFRPNKIEKNTISFNLTSGNPVSGLKLYIRIKKKQPKWKVKATQPSSEFSTRDLPSRTRRRKGRRNRPIKIRVFMSRKKGAKGKRIAEVQKKITETTAVTVQKIALPVSSFNDIPHDPGNNSGLVYIRVECNRCNRRTKLVLPRYDTKRCSRKQIFRQRKNGKGRLGKTKSKRRSRIRKPRKMCSESRMSKMPFIVYD